VSLPVSAGRLLDGSLVYTALTRGAKQVVLLGAVMAAKLAVEAGVRAMGRKTGLRPMLAQAC
jgi:ATP-dependent exoDNAse (exonuclease V) alpha subunit